MAIRVDAGQRMGVGHAVRCLALADELRSRAVPVLVLGELDVPWVAALADGRGIPVLEAEADPEALAAQALSLGAGALVLDGYDLPRSLGTAARAAGLTTMAMVDSDFGSHQDADLYVDQNLGAVRLPDLPADRRMLAGLDYVLFRDEVIDRRPAGPREEHDPLRVLAVFGGTDPFGAAPVVLGLAAETGLPFEATVVAAGPETAARLDGLALAPGQRLHITPPVPDLAGLAATCDLALTASGSSVWELLCLGLPCAVVCVADNQVPGYDEVARRDVAVPIGHLESLRDDPVARADATAALGRLLGDPGLRARLSAGGTAMVPGTGRVAVADALLGLVEARRASGGPAPI